MNGKPKRPYRIALVLVPFLVWIGGAAVIYGSIVALRTPPDDLDTLLGGEALVTDRTVQEELRWTDEVITEKYLASPPGPLPCVSGLETVPSEIRNRVASAVGREDYEFLTNLHVKEESEWLPGLVLARVLIRKGDLRDAEQIVREVARRRVLPVYPDEFTPEELVLARIHQMHLLGYLWIERNYTADDVWVALRNPIGFSKIIARRRSEYAIEVPTWVELRLPSPGCSNSSESLTTYDLYNNLIVGYLQVPSFHDTDDEKREAEFRRDYNDPPEENPLLSVLQVVTREWKPEREYWAWAVSNAERLLRERLVEGEGYPQDARLALNLAQLMESTRQIAPARARTSLNEQIGSLIDIAGKRRSEISATEIVDFDRSLARLLLFHASRAGTPPELLEAVHDHLKPEQQKLVDSLTTALKHRQKPSEWAVAATGENEPPELGVALQSRVRPWRSVSRQDLTASLARLGLAAESPEVRRDRARKAESMLVLNDARPEELKQLEKDFEWWWRFEPRQLLDSARGAALIGGVSGAFLAIIAYWFCLQLRLRKELFTSFYRTEVEQRLRS